MAQKYIKTRSNYTFKTSHKKIDGGTIFERDFMTISGAEGFSPNERPLYRDSNFLFVTRSGINLQRKHRRGEWLTNNCESSFTWTLNCLTNPKNKEGEIKINPNYESLRDFVYYGSCTELVKSTIISVIKNFPAELYFSDATFTFEGTKYYILENDFEIDVCSTQVKQQEDMNIYRYMCLSHNSYNFITSGNTVLPLEWSSSVNGNVCSEDWIKVGLITINGTQVTVIKKGDELKYLYSTKAKIGSRVRPNDTVVDAYYSTIDDFEKLLVNRETNPLYKAIFQTPYQNENGFFTSKKSYIWPNKHGWNVDIESYGYNTYVQNLMTLAEFHDTYDCDNIWRSMTHEAIKNLDWTFTREAGDTSETIDVLDTSKVEPVLKLYGRQYDDVKRYIDNLKYINNITFDKKSNLPDQLIDESLRLQGWEVKALNPSFSTVDEVDVTYPGKTISYSPSECNIEFVRRLRLSTRNVFSKKGTRKGLKEILAIMGFREMSYVETNDKTKAYKVISDEKPKKNPTYSDEPYIQIQSTGRKYKLLGDYTLQEKVAIVQRDNNLYPYTSAVTKYNQLLRDEEEPYLNGLPLREVYVENGNKSASYVIPWYDKHKTYNGDFYFQTKGGWKKTDDKEVWNPVTEEKEPLLLESGKYITIFEETSSCLKYAHTIDEMLQYGKNKTKSGDICYVTDLSGYAEKFGGEITSEQVSHYFALWDNNYWYKPYDGNDKGWVYIPTEAISTETEIGESEIDVEKFRKISGRKILYIESLIDTNEGNNPHVGNNEYDEGQLYLTDIAAPFKEAIANSESAQYLTEEEKRQILNNTSWNHIVISGLTIDNDKCWYFRDSTKTSGWKISGSTSDLPYEMGIQGNVPKQEQTVRGVKSTDIDDESAASSIVNVKNMTITFYINDDQQKHSKRHYIMDRVMFYVSQMMPSTTILECKLVDFGKNPMAEAMNDTSMLDSVSKNVDGVIYGVLGSENDIYDGLDLSQDVKVISTK